MPLGLAMSANQGYALYSHRRWSWGSERGQRTPSFGRNLTLVLWCCIERNQLKIVLGTPNLNIVPGAHVHSSNFCFIQKLFAFKLAKITSFHHVNALKHKQFLLQRDISGAAGAPLQHVRGDEKKVKVKSK